jgi:hypothetical protein
MRALPPNRVSTKPTARLSRRTANAAVAPLPFALQTFLMSHLQSTYFSALCLCFYWGCRAGAPLLIGSDGDRVFKLYFWVLLLESAAYACTPGVAINARQEWVRAGTLLTHCSLSRTQHAPTCMRRMRKLAPPAGRS